MNPKELSAASWELAEACLDILPRDNFAVSGLAIIQLLTVWLAAVPEDQRVQTYMYWMDMLHKHLNQNEVMQIKAVVEAVPVSELSETVH
jgi:hypothetical protein